MDDYGSEDNANAPVDPVFNNDSSVDDSWYNDAGLGGGERQSDYGGAWAEAEAGRGNSWLDSERRREAKNIGRSAEDKASKKESDKSRSEEHNV